VGLHRPPWRHGGYKGSEIGGLLAVEAKPDVLVPRHTRCPELMGAWHDRARVPASGGSVDPY